jgi:hypothetical protein
MSSRSCLNDLDLDEQPDEDAVEKDDDTVEEAEAADGQYENGTEEDQNAEQEEDEGDTLYSRSYIMGLIYDSFVQQVTMVSTPVRVLASLTFI